MPSPKVADTWSINAQFEAVHPTAREYVAAALGKAVAVLQPGWILLRDCVLPAVDGKPPASIRGLMMHPEFGIAMVDVMPGPTTPHAADHLRRLLEVGHFPVRHGGYPPIVYFCVPTRVLPELGLVLGYYAFREQGPPDLSGGATWVDTVQDILSAVPQPRSSSAPMRGTQS